MDSSRRQGGRGGDRLSQHWANTTQAGETARMGAATTIMPKLKRMLRRSQPISGTTEGSMTKPRKKRAFLGCFFCGSQPDCTKKKNADRISQSRRRDTAIYIGTAATINHSPVSSPSTSF